MAHLSFTEADHARIAAAISAAEAGTTGEIYAVFARTSDAYVFVPTTIALALSLVAALLAALFAPLAGFAISGLALVTSQLAATLALLALFALVPRLRMVFVPRAVAEDRAHRMALSQFFAHNIHATVGRTGVLIFVSEAERYAEIVADAEIAAKVPQEAWDSIVADLIAAARDDRLAEGYVQAIQAASAILTAHFPGDHANPNEIDDRLVEI
ncbi:MAG TPA: TPM domain-containing protein [Aurantimonas coralicida]|uniref:TPM domain-containing protein n=2 Tax=root TaxID=1 RepID=A0A9C9NIN2_9HYPH|nr:TPM domain-containing protein [Aurantimonas coralicida]HEU02526.1 TPM domain-containing protein [Aurantimonas coralicida]